jgi:hypothetical protein
MSEEARFCYGLAYQAGKNPSIKKGADGHRDWFTEDELEKAAWSFLRKGAMQVGIMHADGTIGHAEVVESGIYRGPDWEWPDGTIVKAGDWLLGTLLDKASWRLAKAGLLTGFSMQGSGTRVVRSDA